MMFWYNCTGILIAILSIGIAILRYEEEAMQFLERYNLATSVFGIIKYFILAIVTTFLVVIFWPLYIMLLSIMFVLKKK